MKHLVQICPRTFFCPSPLQALYEICRDHAAENKPEGEGEKKKPGRPKGTAGAGAKKGGAAAKKGGKKKKKDESEEEEEEEPEEVKFAVDRWVFWVYVHFLDLTC